MSQLFDARGNEFQGLLDQIGGATLTDARVSSASLGAANAELLMDINGKETAVFDVRTAAANLTLVFEGMVDGTNYYELEQPPVVITTTAGQRYAVNCSGYRRVRARVSAYTSGAVTVTGRASSAGFVIPTTLWVTVTAAAGSAATITLPSAGAGRFHYITHLHLSRNATAALPGTATLVITSTNLPGSIAWSVGNAMAAGGSITDLDVVFTNPLKSSVAATATTIVMPAPGAAVLWRGNCGYYAAP